MHTCLYMYKVHSWYLIGQQQRVSDALKLRAGVRDSCEEVCAMWVQGTKLESFARIVFLITEPFLQSLPEILIINRIKLYDLAYQKQGRERRELSIAMLKAVHRHSCQTRKATEIWLRLYMVQLVEWLPNTNKALDSISKANKTWIWWCMLVTVVLGRQKDQMSNKGRTTWPVQGKPKKHETLSQKMKGGNGKKYQLQSSNSMPSLCCSLQGRWGRKAELRWNFKCVYYPLHFSRDCTLQSKRRGERDEATLRAAVMPVGNTSKIWIPPMFKKQLQTSFWYFWC